MAERRCVRVVGRCVLCGATREVGPQKDHPMCDLCLGPMIAVRAITKRTPREGDGGEEKKNG